MKTRVSAIIVAAGQATRFGAPKVLSPIGGIPSVTRVVDTFQSVQAIDDITIVISEDLRAQLETALANTAEHPPIHIVAGGLRRQDSVLAGIESVEATDIVVVHDAARPMVTTGMIEAAIAAVQQGADAAVAAIPVTDTIKRVTGDNVETVDRANLWSAQTPQAFRRNLLASELRRVCRDGIDVTDESMVIERAGGRVVLVEGADQNLKLTVPADLAVLEALMATTAGHSEPPFRTGIGYDVHRLVAGREVVLGGVAIPADAGLEGHSDADVLLHAICDAVLGACALGDIGHHFPPTDEQYQGISSVILLERVRELVGRLGFAVVNIDATVIAEKPRLGPHVPEMKRAIGAVLQLPGDRIGIKATTNEGIGFAGRREGIAAMAVATVWKSR